jgi:hypothetical protein
MASEDFQSFRVVGKRRERAISFAASGTMLAEGARFNDEMHRLPSGGKTGIPKGVYRFATHEDANEHWLRCVCRVVAQTALERK